MESNKYVNVLNLETLTLGIQTSVFNFFFSMPLLLVHSKLTTFRSYRLICIFHADIAKHGFLQVLSHLLLLLESLHLQWVPHLLCVHLLRIGTAQLNFSPIT